MATLVQPPTSTAVSIPRKVWTRDEARALIDVFPNAARWELVEGEILDKMGKKHPHIFYQSTILVWLQSVYGTEHVLQGPSLGITGPAGEYDEPEPDLLVTASSIRDRTDIPSAADVLLLIEVSDSTLDLDLKVKSLVYARAEILEYWVIDIPNRQIVVHREPVGGQYRSIERIPQDHAISPLTATDSSLQLDRL